eukprot:833054-Lingulodinium_polyedra.AAC.1
MGMYAVIGSCATGNARRTALTACPRRQPRRLACARPGCIPRQTYGPRPRPPLRMAPAETNLKQN